MDHDQLVAKHRAALLAWNTARDTVDAQLRRLDQEARRLDAAREADGVELDELE
jgi:hypothetical protein